ncbi:hypothetical protein LWI28_014516 [Acer negundo]|uniref:Uncharacterized protein n=1 Tax=Acer negundo TaxID=4023 RepID=A0AAD5I6Y3_ACENE|nr:hypothetical protein LWI28_014516 [Acer negundo]
MDSEMKAKVQLSKCILEAEDVIGSQVSKFAKVNDGFHEVSGETSGDVRVKLGYNGKLVVDNIGKKDGLCLLWSNLVDVSLLSVSQYHVDIHVTSYSDLIWRLTDFYRYLEMAQCHHGWELLRWLYSLLNLPWVCARDFNEIIDKLEELRGVK